MGGSVDLGLTMNASPLYPLSDYVEGGSCGTQIRSLLVIRKL